MIVEFLRSDGIGFSAEEGSPAFELMEKDGSFTRVVPVPSVEPDLNAKQDLSSRTKKELFNLAVERDVPVTDKMTKAEIIEAIEAAPSKEETE